jgi:hypothetical protein
VAAELPAVLDETLNDEALSQLLSSTPWSGLACPRPLRLGMHTAQTAPLIGRKTMSAYTSLDVASRYATYDYTCTSVALKCGNADSGTWAGGTPRASGMLCHKTLVQSVMNSCMIRRCSRECSIHTSCKGIAGQACKTRRAAVHEGRTEQATAAALVPHRAAQDCACGGTACICAPSN